MTQLHRLAVWLRRLPHSRGFGIQSPTDYRFVRYVVNEPWPYYAYQELDPGRPWHERKMGHLLLRLANWRQPQHIVDQLGFADYLQAGCRTAQLVNDVDVVELACLPIACDYERLLTKCNEQSVIVFKDIWKQRPLWHCIEFDRRTGTTFDLHYCGIVLMDKRRAKQNYTVNF